MNGPEVGGENAAPTATAQVTTELTVPCGFCGEILTLPFRHGAVMPSWHGDRTVSVFVPTLTATDHLCQSSRAVGEREIHGRHPCLTCRRPS